MKTEASAPPNPEHAKPHSSPAPSPLRLTILLGILVVIAGALVYDWVIAPPRVKAAYDKLLDTAHKHNELRLTRDGKQKGDKGAANNAEARTGGMLYREDIQNILGMSPTKVEKADLYTIEHYCWWGWIPRNRNYITVLYVGNPDKPHYSTHYANEMPEDEAIPGRVKHESAAAQATGAGKETAAGGTAGMMPAMGAPAMGPPGPPSGGGGKGKGRPQNKGDKKGIEKTTTEGEAKKDNEPVKAESPKKDPAVEEEKADIPKGTGDDSK